jgi:hypothetical protein
MGQRLYSIVGADITVANQAVSLVTIHTKATGAGSAIEIMRASVSQSGSTTSGMLAIAMGTKVTAFSTVTAFTPLALNTGDPASGITGSTDDATGHCGINASAEGAGAFTVRWQDSFNIVVGWLWIPTPEERFVIGADLSWHLQFPAAAVPLTHWHFVVIYKELV